MAIYLLIITIFIIVVARFFRQDSKFNLIVFLFTYIFVFGLLELSSLPNIAIKTFIDVLFLFVLFNLFRVNVSISNTLGLFIIFTLSIIFSLFINQSDIYHSLTFLRIYLFSYIIFLFFYNTNLSDKKWFIFNKVVVFLFLLQIIASIYKFFFIGITEKELIGTIDTTGGAYSTTLPIFAISFIISFFLVEGRRIKYVILIFCFLFMGFVGAKRAIWFYTPILFILAWYLYTRVTISKINSSKNLTILILLLLVASGIFIFAGKYSRTLNPENRIGGEFNPEYIKDYTIEYTFSESQSGQVSIGRGANFIRIIKKISNAPPLNLLFGFGPDAVKGSSTYGEGIWGEFGINGPVTGFSANLVQIGLIGSFFVILVLSLGFKTFFKLAKTESSPYWKSIALGGSVSSLMIIIDYFTYSSSFFNTVFALSFTYFYLLGMMLNRQRIKKYMFENKITTIIPSAI